MEKPIHLNELLHLSEEELRLSKIKFNQYNGETNPIDEYNRDPNKVNDQWLFWRNSIRYFSVSQYAICLLKLTFDTWLLTTIKQVTKELGITNGVNYEGIEVERLSQFFGRVIIKYHKFNRTQGVYAHTIMNELEVVQILPVIYDGEDFPGYDNVTLSFSQLETIITRNKRDWIAALEHQKALYLITDTNTGKHYVGSAYGTNGMLLKRWSNYVTNGHGGNVELKKIVDELGFNYVKSHFQYSILENYNSNVDKNFILERESRWKRALSTREWGYNKN